MCEIENDSALASTDTAPECDLCRREALSVYLDDIASSELGDTLFKTGTISFKMKLIECGMRGLGVKPRSSKEKRDEEGPRSHSHFSVFFTFLQSMPSLVFGLFFRRGSQNFGLET